MKKRLVFLALILMVVSLAAIAGAQDDAKPEKGKINAGLLSSLKYREIGPAFMSGRVGDIAVDPNDSSTWYVAICSGNVWKTTNAGNTFTPIFDNYGSYSIGCVTIDPNDSAVIWVGTGENNSQRSVGFGDGIYKSTNGGRSFKNVGLKDSQHIGTIVVDPRDSDVVYVAAQGPLWNAGGDRGLYKTNDGGTTWEKVLEIDEHTGVTEVHMDPRNPDVLYAASYQRARRTWTLIDGGPGSGIHKSIDGGKSWEKLGGGLPRGDVGRIGMDISPVDNNVLYANIEAKKSSGGFFRSDNMGATWQKMSGYTSGSPQYYQEIFADPHHLNRVYAVDTYMQITEDGGKTFTGLGEKWKHVDNHAMHIDPLDPEHLIIGCDGGLYETFDRGENYKFFTNLPITQYYKVAVDYDKPFYSVYGGTQDNATHGGPSRTNNVHGIRNSDWFVTVFGDGFEPAVDPTNPNIVYSMSQHAGIVRHDKATGENVSIKPQPEKGEEGDRWNWDAALMISPNNHKRVYLASQRVYRSENYGDAWTCISGDLTRTDFDRNKAKIMGRIWSVDAVAKNASTSMFGSIVAISESPIKEGLLYVGTDDGLIQITEDDGKNWTRINTWEVAGVPELSYVSDIEADLFDENTVYATLYNYKSGDFKPYVIKSTDRGATWTSIASNLPERGPVFTLKQDHVNKNLMFLGTEFGIFTTIDGGKNWIQMKGGMPTIAVRDIELQREANDVVMATFGRSFIVLDDYTPLRTASEEIFAQDAHIFPIRTALQYVPAQPLSYSKKGFLGSDFYTAENPPFGAVFTYYLKDSLKTAKSERMAKEAKNQKAGGDNFYPTWDELKNEDREENPSLIFTIKDSDGDVVNRITAPARAGMNRIAWNLTYASPVPTRGGRRGGGGGAMAMPGRYSVSMATYVNGVFTELGAEEDFEVIALSDATLPRQNSDEISAFSKKAGKLMKAAMATTGAMQDAGARIQAIKAALMATPDVDAALIKEAREMELKLMDLDELINGDRTASSRYESSPPSMMQRLNNGVRGAMGQMHGPTATNERQLEIAEELFIEVLPTVRAFVETELPALEAKVESLDAPYIANRKIPDYK